MAFRRSQFIDFDTGVVFVPPMELIRVLPRRSEQTIDQMLLVFACRVDVWKFGPAVELLKVMDVADDQKSVWAHSGYALLGMGFSYFEMIGKILNPKSNSRRSASSDFNHGFCDVYPSFAVAGPDRADDKIPAVAEFRDRVRNGMYHLGYPKSNLWIHNQPLKWPDDFTIVSENGSIYYLVNPHQMTRTIVAHFHGFMDRLKNPSGEYDGLRKKFREFFVEFHSVKRLSNSASGIEIGPSQNGQPSSN